MQPLEKRGGVEEGRPWMMGWLDGGINRLKGWGLKGPLGADYVGTQTLQRSRGYTLELFPYIVLVDSVHLLRRTASYIGARQTLI